MARIIGGGMIARALASHAGDLDDVVFYASGVSNSRCTDAREFERERGLLAQSLAEAGGSRALVYFGTCSVYDPGEQGSMYVRHKLECERAVTGMRNGLVVRLPQVAGTNGNRHTFCRWLIDAIRCGERFSVYSRATRYIIDVEDTARILACLLRQPDKPRGVINISSPRAYPVEYYVKICEKVCRRPAHYNLLDRGSRYEIESIRAAEIAPSLGIDFSEGYVERVLMKNFAEPESTLTR